MPHLTLLHGTGGDAESLIGLGEAVAPGWELRGLEGRVMEGESRRWFKRLAPGVFDLDDYWHQVEWLGSQLGETSAVLGYSNGANIAHGWWMSAHPQGVDMVLWRPMVVDPEFRVAPGGIGRVLILHGALDMSVPRGHESALAAQLSHAGADVVVEKLPCGHDLTSDDIRLTQEFLATCTR